MYESFFHKFKIKKKNIVDKDFYKLMFILNLL